MTKGPEGRQSEYAQLITFRNGNIVTEIFFKCHDLLPHKAGLDTSQRHIHALITLEMIHFSPEDGLGMICPVGTFLTSSKLPNTPATLTSVDGGSFVLLTLPVSSSSKGMEVALSLGCSCVFSASAWLC